MCTDLHESMFSMTVGSQGTPEQVSKWMPLAMAHGIIGTYAQTELGHGSNLSGLETTATYDAATQSFDIHSPTLTSTKWWPGGLGKASSHCVVMARLVLDGKQVGTHGFIVQLRRQEDHMPMPGVEVGDIGPKFGFSTQDNGFLRLNHVRIPRDNMLMRFAKVTEAGQYVKPPHAKLSYGTMIGIRANIVVGAGLQLGKAVTVAVRYSAIRRQFGRDVAGSGAGATAAGAGAAAAREKKVLDYETQQFKVLPLLATVFAYHFVGSQIRSEYQDYLSSMDKGDFSALPALHATLAGLKALTSWTCSSGIEECRRACGGHGYSLFSGLPQLYVEYLAAVTYEGENTLMAMQTARFLVKTAWEAAKPGATPPKGTAAYLAAGRRGALATERWSPRSASDCRGTAAILSAFEHCTARMAFALADATRTELDRGAGGMTLNDARDVIGEDYVRAAMAHCQYAVVLVFHNAIESTAASTPEVAPVLRTLWQLYALHTLEARLADFLIDGYVSGAQAAWVHHETRALLREVRPNAVPLVDALNHSDFVLRSALGRWDGRVYESLYHAARNDAPLNATEVVDGFADTLQPLLQKAPWPAARM